MLNFKKITLQDKENYEHLFQACPEKSADYTFINLWAWQNKYQTEIAFEEKFCWLRQKKDSEYIYVAPIGNWSELYWQDIIYSNFEKGFVFHKIPEKLAYQLDIAFPNLINFESDRDNWEYVYNVSELSSLEGGKYRNQRKLSNAFKQQYNYQFKFAKESDLEALKAFQQQWLGDNKNKENELNLEQENKAILRIFNDFAKLGDNLFVSIIMIDNKIVAYSIGEKLDEQNIIIHFEKALEEYKGAYQAINRITLENLSHYKYVNREQDLGLSGLREAKMRYNPKKFIRKYDVNGYFLITNKERENGIFKNCCNFDLYSIPDSEYLPLY